MPKYNKLVRDTIPEIIESQGKTAVTHTASEEEFRDQLKKKLREETQEYLSDQTSLELADILEVVYALAMLHDTTPTELETMRLQRATERGGFTKKIILDEVVE